MLLVWNIMKCENMTMQCWVTQTCFGLTQGEWLMGTLEAVELGHASEVTRLGHPDICYHEITNPNINLVHFSLQPKNLKCTSLAIQCQNGLSVIIRLWYNYALFYFDLFVRKIPKYIGLLGLDLFQCHTEVPHNSKSHAWGFTRETMTFSDWLETTFILN